ncbi:MAG: 3-oxoacyl-[acyl-carrier-protein] reductase [Chloroflexi bacterium]|nr:3-oxoacyl-[acyl-carrier-protein] reductase [Chloroflexota bacterium]
MFDLSGKVALVTGSSRGIGRSIAIHLAEHGADIAINFSRSKDEAEQVKAEIEKLGAKAMTVQADITVPDDAQRMVKETVDGLGRVDILVNNAGFNRDTLLLRMSIEDWDEVMDLNLRAVFLCTKAVLRPMMRGRWGRIINIGSVSGLAGNVGQANYAAAKSGLIGFTRAVAREMGSRDITSNLVAPGLVITELTKDVRQEVIDVVNQRLIIKRMGKPEDIAACVVYLASNEGGYTTGQVLSVDGGLGL